MTEWTEQFRLEALRGLEQEEHDIDTKVAQLRERKTEIQAVKSRYRFPLPDQDLCPVCWFRSGLRSPTYPVSSLDLGKSDDWKCRVCGGVVDIGR
jgi:rubredoxin